MILNMSIKDILMVLPAALIAISFHEMAHGFSAYWLGDNTAKMDGRLTLNPLAHIDPIGFLCLVLVGFGWAKPVRVNPFGAKNRKKFMALTAAAGPIANFLLSFVCMLIGFAIDIFATPANGSFFSGLNNFMMTTASVSLGLGVFNLIPIPPLDGSKIMYAFMPNHLIAKISQYETYLSFGLMILLVFGLLDGVLVAIRGFFMNGMLTAVFWLLGLFV